MLEQNHRIKLVGILNITHDSFSDGGKYVNIDSAIRRIEELILEGVDIIDIGAESTRPGATALTYQEEWLKLEPVLKLFKSQFHNSKVLLSVDTYHPETAALALNYNIDWINDVSGCNTQAMQQLIADNRVKVVLNHNLGVPVRQGITLPENEDAVSLVMQWAQKKIEQLIAQGIKKEQIIFDPGIGFGKTSKQSLLLIKNIKEFFQLGLEILIGHSRKSFFSSITNAKAFDRDIETCMVSAYLSLQNIHYLRVHNVWANKRAIAVATHLFD
ncbi:Dihydropteroate synthase [Rickettsiales bacterium Ac37b]|nr:Dihydropteroate synthase [Rickettsiales bacterium Ac37b]